MIKNDESFFSILPNDLLREIIRKTGQGERYALTTVSKQFYFLLINLFECLIINSKGKSADELINYFNDYEGKIVSLDLLKSQDGINDKSFTYIINKYSLHTLNMSEAFFTFESTSELPSLPSLKKLILKDCSQMTPLAMRKIIIATHNLHELNLGCTRQGGVSCLIKNADLHILSTLQKLERLNLQGRCVITSSDHTYNFIEKLSNSLREVYLPSDMINAVKTLLVNRRIQILSFKKYFNGYTKAPVTKYASDGSEGRGLQYFYYQGVFPLTQELCDDIIQPNLLYLKFNGKNLIWEDFLIRLGSNVPRLESLKFCVNLISFNVEGIENILTVKKLDLWIQGASVEGIERFLQKFPNLESLRLRISSAGALIITDGSLRVPKNSNIKKLFYNKRDTTPLGINKIADAYPCVKRLELAVTFYRKEILESIINRYAHLEELVLRKSPTEDDLNIFTKKVAEFKKLKKITLKSWFPEGFVKNLQLELSDLQVIVASLNNNYKDDQ